MPSEKKRVKVLKLPIRLGQFLKLADIVQDGFEAKMRIIDGDVEVNEVVETRRGKQLHHLDEIRVDGCVWIVELSSDHDTAAGRL